MKEPIGLCGTKIVARKICRQSNCNQNPLCIYAGEYLLSLFQQEGFTDTWAVSAKHCKRLRGFGFGDPPKVIHPSPFLIRGCCFMDR